MNQVQTKLQNLETEWQDLMSEINSTISQLEGELKNPILHDNSWLNCLKDSPTFAKLPADKLTALIMKFEEYPVPTGEVVVRQKDSGDYFYVVKAGTYTVSQRPAPGEIKILAQLKSGDTFGEASLVSGEPRNASVVADTDGILYRLSKSDFELVLKTELVKQLDKSAARKAINEGAVVLDVRHNRDRRENIPGAIEIPLDQLRDRLSELETEKSYVVTCSNGRQSEAAAFLLSQKGYKAAVLRGGLKGRKQ